MKSKISKQEAPKVIVETDLKTKLENHIELLKLELEVANKHSERESF